MKKIFVLILIISSFPYAFRNSSAATLDAATCATGKNAAPPGLWRWANGASISVRFKTGDFKDGERAALSLAVAEWNGILQQNDSKITLTVKGESANAEPCPGCLTVIRADLIKQEQRVGEIYPYLKADDTTIILAAVVLIDRKVDSPTQLSSIFEHELAHSFGLDDCPACERGSTIMASYKGVNKGNGSSEPSVCDRRTVADRYSTDLIHQAPVTSSFSNIGNYDNLIPKTDASAFPLPAYDSRDKSTGFLDKQFDVGSMYRWKKLTSGDSVSLASKSNNKYSFSIRRF